MIEHRRPTSATVKKLYGSALTCAFEGCCEPVVKKIDDEYVLNANVCHINARSELGPRWDPNQTEEQNRSFSNLILMCKIHSSLIDDPLFVEKFSAPELQALKVKQIQRAEERGGGIQISDDLLFEALDQIVARSPLVRLGGTGGAAPGAGGGGGAAVGGNARGGDGGAGGNMFSGDFMIEKGTTLKVHIGKGGQSGQAPGEFGIDGGDTRLQFFSPENEMLGDIIVEGGKAGLSGSAKFSDGWKVIDDIFVTRHEFRVTSLAIVNYGECTDGRFTLCSTHVSHHKFCNFNKNCTFFVYVATLVEISAQKLGFFLRIIDPLRVERARVAVHNLDIDEKAISMHAIVPIGCQMDILGDWCIVATSENIVLNKFIFTVIEAPNVVDADDNENIP